MSEGFDEKDRLLDVARVAEYLGVSEVTVYRWCREGTLPCLKIGRSLRVRRSALEDFLERSERSPSLVGQMRSFLRVPDNVLGIAQTQELLYRLVAAYFRVGEARGGLLVKFYGPYAWEPLDELRSRLEDEGLDVARLEDEERIRFVDESDSPGERAEALRRIADEKAEEGHTLWACFDWTSGVDLEEVLGQQEALTRFVDDRQLVVMTAMPEQEADEWPSMIQRRAQTLHSGTAWLSEEGLLTSRLTPLTGT